VSVTQEICRKLKRDNGLEYSPEQVVCSNGAKQSLLQTIMALSCPGDEMIIPTPSWVSYSEMCTMSGSKPVFVTTTVAQGYVLQPEQLEAAITPRTKLLLLCTPGNPTGTVYTREQLLALTAVLARHPRVWVVSDEIYEHILYEGASHVSLAALPGMYDKTITINGFSKCYAMTGFRLGYLAAPLPIAQACNKIQGHITSCPCSVSQYAGIAALQMGLGPVHSMVDELKIKRKLVCDALRSCPGLVFHQPQVRL
jgi:aspartate/methionine/tyrosine aminotransferase